MDRYFAESVQDPEVRDPTANLAVSPTIRRGLSLLQARKRVGEELRQELSDLKLVNLEGVMEQFD